MVIKKDAAVASLATKRKSFEELFQDNDISIEVYKPVGTDKQQPHDRDEVYVIISGSGSFRLQDELFDFGPGDLIIVPAGVVHRFEKFSDDFSTWVIFYGAKKAP